MSSGNKINVAHSKKCFWCPDQFRKAEGLLPGDHLLKQLCELSVWLMIDRKDTHNGQHAWSPSHSVVFLHAWLITFSSPSPSQHSIHAGLPVIKPPLVYKCHWRVTEEKQQPLSRNPVAVALWIPINTGCILKQYITIQQINCSQHQKLIWNHIRKSKKKKYLSGVNIFWAKNRNEDRNGRKV